MRLPEAYRSLPRPSSSLKPSHPPDGVGVPDLLLRMLARLCVTIIVDLIHYVLHSTSLLVELHL